MKTSHIKHFVVIILLVLLSYFVTEHIDIGEKAWMIFIIACLLLFFFNVAIRKNEKFQSYFSSRYNLLTNKYSYQEIFDFQKETLFPKMLEVLEHSGFKIENTDRSTGDIFATSSISWYSWGENIYIQMEETEGKTRVSFTSVCLLQVYDWGKNKDNLDKIIKEFEDSLII